MASRTSLRRLPQPPGSSEIVEDLACINESYTSGEITVVIVIDTILFTTL